MLSTTTAIRVSGAMPAHVIDSVVVDWDAIHAGGVNLLVRPRQLPVMVPEALANTHPGMAGLHENVSADVDCGFLAEWFAGCGAGLVTSEWLARDISALVGAFAAVCKRERVQMHLETLDDDECRLFHVDRNHLRLLCTYHGPGTEWLTNDQVDRSGLGRGDNRYVLKYGQIQQTASGAVLLLKGERYPGNAGNGVVHRSPPIRAHGLRRWRLRLDLPDYRGC